MGAIANSSWMYALGALVFVYVLATSVSFIIRSVKQAKAIGMDSKVLKKTVTTSFIFSLLPSISILIGVLALSGSLGVPLPWIRLSVIGALHYEQTAFKAALDGAIVTLETITPQQFVTVATVMTTFILSGPIFCLVAFKKYDQKLLSKAKAKDDSEVKEEVKKTKKPKKERKVTPVKEGYKRKPFGSYLFSAAFIALVSSFLAEDLAKLKNIGKMDEINEKTGEVYGSLGSFTPAIVIAVAFGSMALFTFISKRFKQKWLEDFALGFSMILGMASAVLVEYVVK